MIRSKIRISNCFIIVTFFNIKTLVILAEMLLPMPKEACIDDVLSFFNNFVNNYNEL